MKFLRITLLTLVVSSIVTSGNAQKPTNYINPQGADAEVEQVRQSFEKAYHDMIAQGAVDTTTYNNNLTIKTTLEGDVQKEGIIMLALLDWLSHRKNHDSKALLHKLNRLYYLELNNLIASKDGKKDIAARMLHLSKELYRFKTVNPVTKKGNRPFRSSLSRIFIIIAMINGGPLSYENRKKSMAMALEQIGDKMLRINKKLLEQKTSDHNINEFISLLSTHAFTEPFIKPATLKWIIAGSIATITISYFAFDYLLDAVTDRIIARGKKRYNDNQADIKEAIQSMIRQTPAVSFFVPYSTTEDQAFANRQNTRGWGERQIARVRHWLGRQD